jgi:methylmalonyl-CoA/ethylmalonyl-CoA epimerase
MAADPALALGPIGQISLSITDLDRAVAFYKNALGLKHLFNAPPGLAFFDAGGTRLMLALPEQPGEATHSSVLYFRVPDVHAATAALAGRGVSFESEPRMIARMPDHDLWLAMFRDSEHNLLGLMCEMPRK